MPRTPNCWARAGSASTSILMKRALGSSACAALSNTGAMARQGPHQPAQKSTISGTSLDARCLRNRSVVMATGWPPNRADLQRPHLAARASFSVGRRLVASQ